MGNILKNRKLFILLMLYVLLMSKENISITISKELLEKIDKKRGLIPRSTYIEKILKEKT